MKNLKFEKISLEQLKKDVKNRYSYCSDEKLEEIVKEMRENISLPKRATRGSAGYDFFLPVNLTIPPGCTTDVIPTGIRCRMDKDVVLLLFPRSGLGFKYGLSLMNTTGVIDSDYYEAKNEGHIKIKLHNPSNETVILKKGSAVMQGVFVPYFLTDDDESEGERVGGFGSTDKNGNCLGQ